MPLKALSLNIIALSCLASCLACSQKTDAGKAPASGGRAGNAGYPTGVTAGHGGVTGNGPGPGSVAAGATNDVDPGGGAR